MKSAICEGKFLKFRKGTLRAISFDIICKISYVKKDREKVVDG